jgi:uncharacterized membrane protein
MTSNTARRAACDFSVGRYTTNWKSDFSSRVLTFSCVRYCHYFYCIRLSLFCRISTPYISNLIRALVVRYTKKKNKWYPDTPSVMKNKL